MKCLAATARFNARRGINDLPRAGCACAGRVSSVGDEHYHIGAMAQAGGAVAL